MKDIQKIVDDIEARESQMAARRALHNDGATGAIDIGGVATAGAIAETPSPAAHMGQWEQMSRVEQGINALEASWHNRQKSQTYAEFVDAVESADAGYASRTGDIDGTDEESQKEVADLLSRDTKVNAQYKQQQLERARKAYGDYKALEADDYQYHTPHQHGSGIEYVVCGTLPGSESFRLSRLKIGKCRILFRLTTSAGADSRCSQQCRPQQSTGTLFFQIR